MIDTTPWIWFGVGLLVGSVHSTLLRHGVQKLNAWLSLLGLLRVGIVAMVLLISALNDAIIVCAGGWIIGFVSLAVFRVKTWGEAHKG